MHAGDSARLAPHHLAVPPTTDIPAAEPHAPRAQLTAHPPSLAHLVDPEGRRPGLHLVLPQLLNHWEASWRHVTPQAGPPLVAQQHLPPVGCLRQLTRHLQGRV